MRLLTKEVAYDKTIRLAANLSGEYTKPVIFHCFWKGKALNQTHLYSIKSCHYFNVYKRNHKIILWVEDNSPNKYNKEIAKYAEIRYFSLKDEAKDTFLETYDPGFSGAWYYADYVRSLLLYKYGGCWFDLDCFFLRSFDPLFHNYGKEICLYQWENKHFPNNAIYISLEPKSDKMKKNIEFIIKCNRGWGFRKAQLTYNSDLDLLVLPCSWFDGGWIENPYNIRGNDIINNTSEKYDFDTFFKGAFCYHWHSQQKFTAPNSVIVQLTKLIDPNTRPINRFHYYLYLLTPVKDFFVRSLKPHVRKVLVQIKVKKP